MFWEKKGEKNPESFQAFETAYRWFPRTLKENQKKTAAAKVWSKLTVLARSVARHVDVDPVLF